MYDYATRQEQINIKNQITEVKTELQQIKNNTVSQLDSILLVQSTTALAICFAIVLSVVRKTIWRR